MDWKAALKDNWPYKLAAAALAVLLWFNVSANENRMEQVVGTRLELELRDDAWVPVDVPSDVQTTFRGRLGDMFGLPGNVVIRRTVEEVSDSVLTLRLQPDMVEYDRRLNVQPVAVRPAQVLLRFQPMEEKRVPVTIDLHATAAEGFTLLGDPLVRPESVTVRAARSEADALSHVETEEVSLGGLRETTTRQVPLRVPADLETVRIQPATALITLRVDTLIERRMRVPVHAAGRAAAQVAVSPGEVEVVLRGARSVVAEIEVEEVRATVEVAERPEAPVRLPVRVRISDGIPATAEADPPLVLVSPGVARAGEEGG